MIAAGRNISLHTMEPEDQEFVARLNGDPVVKRNVVGWDFPVSMHAQKEWYFSSHLRSETQRWIVREKSSLNPVGLSGLWEIDWRNRNAVVGIKLGGQDGARGSGYGRDTLQLVSAYAFYIVGLERLYAPILSDNIASQVVFRKHAGWTLEGTSRNHVWRNGRYCDVVNVGLLREDFDAREGSKYYIDAVLNAE